MSTSTRSLAPVAADVVALTKPRITMMAVLTAAGAMVLAPGAMPLTDALVSLLAIGLLVSGAGALNMFIERDVDGLMVRTRTRPLPAGRLNPPWGALVGAFLCALAFPLLVHSANAFTALLGAFSLFMYVLVYTPMKRTSAWAMILGAVPGAMPALMGYTASSGTIDPVAATIFAVLFFWQVPHFLAISIYRFQEYRDAGYVVFPDRSDYLYTRIGMAIGAVAVAVSTLALYLLDVGGGLYLAAALALGAYMLVATLRAFTDEHVARRARKIFIATLIYQTLLFGMLAADVAIGTHFG
jgi:protoheme IX farnesyltransferase